MKNYCVSIVFLEKFLFKKSKITNAVAIVGGLSTSDQAVEAVKESLFEQNPKLKTLSIEISTATEIPYGL